MKDLKWGPFVLLLIPFGCFERKPPVYSGRIRIRLRAWHPLSMIFLTLSFLVLLLRYGLSTAIAMATQILNWQYMDIYRA